VSGLRSIGLDWIGLEEKVDGVFLRWNRGASLKKKSHDLPLIDSE